MIRERIVSSQFGCSCIVAVLPFKTAGELFSWSAETRSPYLESTPFEPETSSRGFGSWKWLTFFDRLKAPSTCDFTTVRSRPIYQEKQC